MNHMNRIGKIVDRLGKLLFAQTVFCLPKLNQYDTELADKVDQTTWDCIGERADRLGNMRLFRRLFLCCRVTQKK